MEAALWVVAAMTLSAPVIGYLRATAWAAENGLVRKEVLQSEPIAMSFH